MFSLFKKEIIQFFGSLTGYLVAIVFLIFAGLFLWIFGGNYNIPDGGYATLDGLFEIAPWLYLFLIPAVTMRMFADEKKFGTLELLFTRPLTEFQIVLVKFFSSLMVITVTLVPTLLYFFSVYELGNPIGSIDTGAAWGSYLGLFFLAVIYLAIGLFTSSVTDNQIIAFILGMFLCFFWYTGFDFIAEITNVSDFSVFLAGIGINNHYESISRGVIDSRDLFYFLFITFFFLILTGITLKWNRRSLKRSFLYLGVYVIAAVIITAVSHNSFFRIDLTKEKRYTLSQQSKEILSRVKSPILAEIFLEGDLPSGFRKLQSAVTDQLQEMRIYCREPIQIKITNPYTEVGASLRSKYFQNLIQRGIIPTNVRIKTEEGIVTKLLFPAILLRSGGKEVVINLLSNNTSLRDEENFIHSIELLEYELARGFRLLLQNKKENIGFLSGHGELDVNHIMDFNQALKENFNTVQVTPDQLNTDQDSISVLIIAAPENQFGERDKLIIDQYLMKGGRIMWFLDPVKVSMDSLSNGMSTLAFPRKLNLDDQLFHYGVRLNSDLVQDDDCIGIKVNTALPGQSPKYTVAPWYFTPLLQPVQDHPIGKNVNRVVAEFVSSVDFVGENNNIKGSVILTSSPHARTNKSPMIVSLAMIDAPPSKSMFNKHYLPAGILLEGKFSSVFKNRITEQLGFSSKTHLITESSQTKMMIFTNGRLIANKINREGDNMKIVPLGYDPVSRITFGNKEFFVNAVNYLCDHSGLMELRSRTMKMRLLDKVKLREELFFWQILNVAAPVVFLILSGLVFWFLRHRGS